MRRKTTEDKNRRCENSDRQRLVSYATGWCNIAGSGKILIAAMVFTSSENQARFDKIKEHMSGISNYLRNGQIKKEGIIEKIPTFGTNMN